VENGLKPRGWQRETAGETGSSAQIGNVMLQRDYMATM